MARTTKEPTEDLTTGRMTARVECKITPGLDAAINDVARGLAGGGDPRMFRSRAVRALLVEAVEQRRGKGSARPVREGARKR